MGADAAIGLLFTALTGSVYGRVASFGFPASERVWDEAGAFGLLWAVLLGAIFASAQRMWLRRASGWRQVAYCGVVPAALLLVGAWSILRATPSVAAEEGTSVYATAVAACLIIGCTALAAALVLVIWFLLERGLRAGRPAARPSNQRIEQTASR